MILCSDPGKQATKYQKEIKKGINRVLSSNSYILGQELYELEKEFANYIGTKFSIGVANGTDALEISLEALGIGKGDEVITVSHTAIATVSAIVSRGAKPVFVDIEEPFFTLDPNKLQSEVTNNTKAVIAVHLYGQSVDLYKIKKFCIKNNLYLIEDVSQAHGGLWGNKKLGSIGVIGCFSCYPTKNLGALGDAGLITTNDIKLRNKIAALRQYGWEKRNYSSMHGRNSRLDEIQAAILRVKLKYLDQMNQSRQRIAKLYLNNLIDLPLSLPKIRQNSSHVFHIFSVCVEKRNDLLKFLKKNNIIAGIHYPLPVHLQPSFNEYNKYSKLSITEKISLTQISLPMYPELMNLEIEKIINSVRNFFGK